MDCGLEGRRAVVGGASRGIGLASARELAALGASVTLLARGEEYLERSAADLPSDSGQQHGYVKVDFNEPDSAARALRDEMDRIGPVHVLINNSGGPPGGPLLDASLVDFERALRSHLFASHLLVQTVVPGMKSSGYGRIINIISISVRKPIPGLGVSNTTRGAMASWAKTLSGELAPHGITVNNVLPGFTGTDRLYELIRSRAKTEGITAEEEEKRWLSDVPMGRFADPQEIGAVVAFLASPAASYVTGISMPVDGGFIDAI